jgi:hypothetical protein
VVPDGGGTLRDPTRSNRPLALGNQIGIHTPSLAKRAAID